VWPSPPLRDGFELTRGERQRNYLFYRHLVLSALHASDPTLIESAKSLLSELDSSIGSKERAPKLALLELDLRLRSCGASSGAVGMSDEEYVERIKAYWDQWGAKGCVVDDFRTVIRGDPARADLICGFLGFLEGWMGDKEHVRGVEYRTHTKHIIVAGVRHR
jgi:hypothetical protein